MVIQITNNQQKNKNMSSQCALQKLIVSIHHHKVFLSILQLEEFYNANSEALSSVSSTIQSAITSARSNLEWTTTFASQLTAWFTRDSAMSVNINVSVIIWALILVLTFWRRQTNSFCNKIVVHSICKQTHMYVSYYDEQAKSMLNKVK